MLKRQDVIGVLELPGDAGAVHFVEVPETASLEYVAASGPDVRRQPQYQRPEVSAQHDILQGLDHDSASGIGLPPPSQLGKAIGFDKAVPFDIARDGGPRRIKRRGAARRRHPLKAQLEIEEVFVATRETTLADDQIPFSEADLVRQQTLGSKDSFLTVGGTHIADREEAIRALRRAAYDVRPGCQETIGTYRGLSVVCRRQHVLDDDWLPYIGLAVDPAKHVHMSERVFPSGEKGAFTVLTQMDRIIAKDAKGPAEIELKLGTAQRALADAQKAAKEPFPKQAELDELEQRLAVLEYERIEAELQCQREQAQRDEAEAAAIEVGVEEERETEREHERAAAADDEAREAARMAELRRQGLICEDSAAHNAATAVPNGVALGVPDDIAEAARCSAAASARDGRAEGEKRKAGM